MIATAVVGNEKKGSVFLFHSDMRIGGTPEEPESLAEDVVKQCTDEGHLEVFQSDYLRGGVVLDTFRDAVTIDLSSIGRRESATVIDLGEPQEFSDLRTLFESVWSALRYKQWWAGKEAYKIDGVTGNPRSSNGRRCGSKTWFNNGEMFLFIDEPSDVKITVTTSASRTEQITLRKNQRYQVVVHESSTCIYFVASEYRNASRHSDENFSCEISCPCDSVSGL
jgi:hypothetical protein